MQGFLSRLLIVSGLLLPLGSAPALAASSDLPAALAAAAKQGSAVIVDFHAPWCYSCYYMATHVLNGPEWDAVTQRAVVLAVDADAPDGAALKETWQIAALPSYLVLDAQGHELGRILGEQTREEFYAALNRMLDRGDSVDALRAEVAQGDGSNVDNAVQVLESYLARRDVDAGLSWFASLPADVRSALGDSAPVGLALNRLRLLDAASQKNAAACAAIGPAVMDGALGCERSYEMWRYMSCLDDTVAQRPALLAAQRPAMEALVASGVFAESPQCADERSAILATADLYTALGDAEAEQALLSQAIERQQALVGGDFASDRNRVDNLRVYLDRAGDVAALDALMPKLIAAWPDDYVYAFRYGRSLLQRGEAEAALPYLQQAAEHAYGVNRLQVVQQRVIALQQLGRDAEARKVVAQALKANGPWFPEKAQALKAMLRR